MDRRTMLKATGSAAALSILGGIPLAKAGEAGKLKKSQKNASGCTFQLVFNKEIP